LLAGGNPVDLTSASALNSKVSSAGVQQATAALRAVLANVATSAGMNAGSFDPVSPRSPPRARAPTRSSTSST
jgi:hypothetical protein